MNHINKYLTVPNSGLQKHEPQDLKTGEESSLMVAIQSPLIQLSPVEDLKQVLRLVMMKVGIRAGNLPDDLEKLVLINHIIENYGGNRIEEIKLAFEMAIAGKLTFLDGESVLPYENFSCLYFSSVMNAYRRWSAQAYKQLAKPAPLEEKKFTTEDLMNEHRGITEACFQRFKKGDEKYFPTLLMEDILKADGIIREDETVKYCFKRLIERENIYVTGASNSD